MWIQLGSSTLFALWALYISVVEHPARLGAGAAAGLAQWRASYGRAAPWQASAAAAGLVSGLAASLVTGDRAWALAGVVLGLVIPFTLLVVMPTNRLLLATTTPRADTADLLARWGRLHAVRTALGLVALVILLVAAHRG